MPAHGFANMHPLWIDQMVVAGLLCSPGLPPSLPPRLPIQLQEPAQPRRIEPRDRKNVPDHGAAQVQATRAQGPAGTGSQEELQLSGRHRE
jgi:hypothetical protein